MGGVCVGGGAGCTCLYSVWYACTRLYNTCWWIC
jgi:hypothetical protein